MELWVWNESGRDRAPAFMGAQRIFTRHDFATHDFAIDQSEEGKVMEGKIMFGK